MDVSSPSRNSSDVDAGLLDALPVGILICSLPSGGVCRHNARVARLFGRAPAEGTTLAGFLASHRAATTVDAPREPDLAAIVSGNEIVDADIPLERPDGRTSWLSMSVSPVRDDAGRIVAAAAVFSDVTARRAAEDALRQSEAAYRATFELAGSAKVHADPHTCRILRVNRRFSELVGYTADELQDMTTTQLTHPADAADEAHRFASLLAGAIPEYSIEKRYIAKGGRVVWASASVTILRDRAGRPIRSIAAILDITHRRQVDEERARLLRAEQQARQEAEEASRLKDEFLATLSHELRTPITAIIGWSRMLVMRQLGPDRLTHAAAVIERNARAQAQLVEDLLDISRVVTGNLRLDVRPVDLCPIVDAAIETIRPGADAKGLRVTTALDLAAGPVSGDPVRLQQIVWNLLSNAVKFTPAGGRVDVTARRTDDHAEICVSDTGDGIAPEFLPYVFDRFRQGDATTTRGHGGLGLGLAIVRHLTEMHGGQVAAESEGRGRGTRFTVRFPLARAAQAPDATRVGPS
jgi:PAS domain S-box-containing protein